MPWVRLDEKFARNPKVVRVGPLGMAMQVAALCYCNDLLTDGFVPRNVASTLLDFDGLGMDMWTSPEGFGGGQDAEWDRVVALLVEVGMWEEAPGGWQIHDYEEYQPSRASVLADREAAAERRRKAQEKKTEERAKEAQTTTTRTSPKRRANVTRTSPERVENVKPPDPDPEVPKGTSSSSTHHVDRPVDNPEEEEDPRIHEALTLLAGRHLLDRLKSKPSEPVVDRGAWLASTTASLRAEHFDALITMCVNGTTPEAMADALEPPMVSASLAAAKPSTPKWDLDEAGNAVPLVTP